MENRSSPLSARLLAARSVLDRASDSAAARVFRVLGIVAVAVFGIRTYGHVLSAVYPIGDWLVWDLARLWGYMALLGAACVGAGLFVVRGLLGLRDRPVLESVALGAAVGLVSFVVGMYLGGFLHLYGGAFAITLPLVMLLVGAPSLLSLWREVMRARSSGRSLVVWAASAWGLISLAFMYLGLMTPDAINFDAAWCHIPIAQDYARAGRIIPFPGDYARTVPHLASMVHTWAFLVPGLTEQLRWMLVLHDEFLFFLFTLVGVGAATQWLVDDPRLRGGWTAFFLFPAIFVYDSNIGGAADHYLAFFASPILLATGRVLPRFSWREALLFGVFVAGALLTKYQAVYLLGAALVVLAPAWLRLLLLRIRRRMDDAPTVRELFLGPLAAALVAFCLLMFHFGKNWVFYKNPVYPFMQDTFRSSTPTTHDAEFLFEYLFKDWNWRPHGTTFQNLKDALALSVSFSFYPHYSFTKQVPNFGSLFTLCLPLLLFVKQSRRLWLGALIGWLALMMWGLTFRVDRNLQGIAPILAAVTAGLLVRGWALGGLARLALVPLVGLQIAWGGDAMFYEGHNRLRSSIELIRSGFEGKRKANRFDYRHDFRQISAALPKDARVLLHETRANLGINREILMDIAGQQSAIQYEGLSGPREVYDYYKARGISHLLFIPGQRMASTVQEDILFWHFVRRYGQASKRFGGYELLQMPSQPPPPDGPYNVLSVGLPGYKDGLYPIEAMGTYEHLPRHLLKYNAPSKPLPKNDGEALKLLTEATAATIGAKTSLPEALTTQLKRDFSVLIAYNKGYTIYLRNGATSPTTPPAEPTLGGEPPPAAEDPQ